MTPAPKLDKTGKLRLSEAEEKRIKAMHTRLQNRGGCNVGLERFRDWLLGQRIAPGAAWSCSFHGATNMPKAMTGLLQLSDIHIDHLLPLARRGTGRLLNLAVSCRVCNERKGTLTGDEFRTLCAHVNLMTHEAQAYIWQKLGAKPGWK